MNSNYTSKSELTLSQFPPVPIYSGHFHLPQTLKSKNKSKNNKITYIGSPYQQSFSEAGDVKRFLVLNKEFEVKESLEVGRVGREYFIGLENVGECVEGDVVRGTSMCEEHFYNTILHSNKARRSLVRSHSRYR